MGAGGWKWNLGNAADFALLEREKAQDMIAKQRVQRGSDQGMVGVELWQRDLQCALNRKAQVQSRGANLEIYQ